MFSIGLCQCDGVVPSVPGDQQQSLLYTLRLYILHYFQILFATEVDYRWTLGTRGTNLNTNSHIGRYLKKNVVKI
jgi:hypothetical protein